MSKALKTYVQLVADVAVARAQDLADKFSRAMHLGVSTDPQDPTYAALLTGFSFMNYTLATGVWSNLSDQRLRVDLMRHTRDALAMRLASELSTTHERRATAAVAAAIATDDLPAYFRAYLNRTEQLERVGQDADARTAALFCLETLQRELSLPDAVLDRGMPSFFDSFAPFDQVEEIAGEVNAALAERRRRSFWSRMFGRS